MENNNLQHTGVLGMKWGKRKAKATNSTNSKKPVKNISPYAKERQRQKKYLAQKHSIDLGRRVANNYLSNRQYTLDGKPITANAAASIIQTLLMKNYASNS